MEYYTETDVFRHSATEDDSADSGSDGGKSSSWTDSSDDGPSSDDYSGGYPLEDSPRSCSTDEDDSDDKPSDSDDSDGVSYSSGDDESTRDSEDSTSFIYNPPHFSVRVESRHLVRNNGIRVPSEFARKFLPAKSTRAKEMILKTEHGSFVVQYRFHKRFNGWAAELGFGWERFAQTNKLHVNDILDFELDNLFKQIYRVKILR